MSGVMGVQRGAISKKVKRVRTAKAEPNNVTWRCLLRILCSRLSPQQVRSLVAELPQDPHYKPYVINNNTVSKLRKPDTERVIVRLTGPHMPIRSLGTTADGGRPRNGEYLALAELLTSYWGSDVTEDQARAYISVPRHQRFQPTEAFWQRNAGRCWPPCLPGPQPAAEYPRAFAAPPAVVTEAVQEEEPMYWNLEAVMKSQASIELIESGAQEALLEYNFSEVPMCLQQTVGEIEAGMEEFLAEMGRGVGGLDGEANFMMERSNSMEYLLQFLQAGTEL
jgi:hypothetical protein